jgi:hypothetical protein
VDDLLEKTVMTRTQMNLLNPCTYLIHCLIITLCATIRNRYAGRVKEMIRTEEMLDMVASTGCSHAVRQRLKDRRRVGKTFGYTERARRLTTQVCECWLFVRLGPFPVHDDGIVGYQR